MNKENLTKFISNPFTITFSILLVILSIVMFNIITRPKPFEKLTKTVDEINFVNNKKLTSKEPTSNDYITEFNKNISDLKAVKNELSTLEIPADFNKHKDSLFDIIDKNIKFYDTMIYFLKNIESENILEHSNNVTTAKNEFEKASIKAKEFNLSINTTFNKESLLSHFSSYSNELIKLYRDKNIHISQTSTFKTSLDAIYTKLGPLNEDLFVIIDLVKEDGRTLESVLNSINEKIEAYKELNLELHSLSVPEGYDKLFTSLKTILKKYDIYIHAIRDYVIHDINSSATKELRKKAEETYENLNKSIVEYLTLANEFK